MERFTQQITIFDNVTPVQVTSSTNVPASVVTTTTPHGYVTGQRVLIQGHATNIAINGIFTVVVLTASTFTLKDEFTGADIAAVGVGTGGFTLVAPPVINTMSFRNMSIQFGTSGSATGNIGVFTSFGRPDNQTNAISPRKLLPNFGATLAVNNMYTPIQEINLDTGVAINGSTGNVLAGTDLFAALELNFNNVPYVCIYPTAWMQGAITMTAFLADNK